MIDHGHAEVHDVAAVAASVAMEQVHHRGQQILSGVARDHAAAANELRSDGQRHQRGQHGGHQRVEVCDVLPRPDAEGDHQHPDRKRPQRRPHEVALQALE